MVQMLVSVFQWKAVVVKWDDDSPVALIYVINDYESFFRDPLNYGVYRTMDTEIMLRNWLDRQDLVFTLEKRLYEHGLITEAPVIGSHRPVYGTLKDLVQVLRDNAPPISSLPSLLPYDERAFQRSWDRIGLNGRLAVPEVPNTRRDSFGVLRTTALSSSSISSESNRILESIYRWRAVVVEWDSSSPLELVFIINDYENFYIDPLANGVYKYVDKDLLLQNSIDRNNLIFTWEKRWYDDASSTEFPVNGSQRETYGALQDLIEILRDNEP